jgi:hypothetical protein
MKLTKSVLNATELNGGINNYIEDDLTLSKLKVEDYKKISEAEWPNLVSVNFGNTGIKKMIVN